MERAFYDELAERSIKREILPDELCLELLTSPRIELLRLLDAAYQVRKKYTGNEVQLHIINNAQNGGCPEDCHYCTQAKSSTTGIETYPVKPDAEILAEAQRAYESGAYRYCMVFAGRG
ncbi:MAG: biotin synthase BioB, partial [Candidatus Poribacteria bacterium]|nr:biotin synthase BioB [Candidatus Poribacteria bacterium]